MTIRFNMTQAEHIGEHLDAIAAIANEAGWLCVNNALVSNVRNKYNEMKEKLNTVDVMLTATENSNGDETGNP